MADQPFKFKQFIVHQDQCAMKIGTDAVLLGSWVSVEHHPYSILDIGSGSGIIALMLAQRSEAKTIDAIEIEPNAFEQCVFNFEHSPWNNRLFCYHASVQEFTEEVDDTYDLIVCNPPFYSNSFKSKSKQRDLARFQDALPLDNLFICVSKLLSENGRFSLILPADQEMKSIELAHQFGLFPKVILQIKGSANTDHIRSLIEFSYHETEVEINALVIETGRHQYTHDYINLTKDFYLKM